MLAGALRHSSSVGAPALLGAGTVQVQSAGTGLTHAEVADPASGPTRFVQTWLSPAQPGGTPTPAVSAAVVETDGLIPVVGGAGLPLDAAAVLWLGRVGGAVALPEAARLHLFVASGRLTLATGSGAVLTAGATARITDELPPADADPGTHLMVWALG